MLVARWSRLKSIEEREQVVNKMREASDWLAGMSILMFYRALSLSLSILDSSGHKLKPQPFIANVVYQFQQAYHLSEIGWLLRYTDRYIVFTPKV